MINIINSLKAFRHEMLDCEISRNNNYIGTYKGLISDDEKYHFISFDIGPEILPGDDIFCPLKNKHYIVTNADIVVIHGKQDRLDVYFQSEFIKPKTTNVFNTYNPNSSIIGNQTNATINNGFNFEDFSRMINLYGSNDKDRLNELLSSLEECLKNDDFSKSKLKKFSDLISKHSWLPLAISQLLAAWIQR